MAKTYPARQVWDQATAFLRRPGVWIGLLGCLVTLLCLLYIRYVFFSSIDHDEVEHAHVGFRILSGLVPYQDFYQNHWPAYWLATRQFVEIFPHSVNAILAGRAMSLIALIGSGLLGLRLLTQLKEGQTWLAHLIYIFAVVLLAYMFDFHTARPDPVMAFFGTAALCLIPMRGLISGKRALLLGVLFGIAASVSTKILPMTLVVPALVVAHCVRDHSAQPGIVMVPYGLGALIALLPTAFWILNNGLLEAFYFDVWELNLATSKPWTDALPFIKVPIYMASLLGTLAWLTSYRNPRNRYRNGPLILALAMGAGLVLSAIARHGGLYNLQILTIPIAIGFTNLLIVLWRRTRGLGFRLLLLGALLGYPVTYVGSPLVRLPPGNGIPLEDLQALMDLARPPGSTCMAFSPSHPVFCHDVSTLANQWDLYFAEQISDPRQLQRFRRIWREGIEATLEQPPDILLRSGPIEVWERAVKAGLITAKELEALDQLQSCYTVMHFGKREVWKRQSINCPVAYGFMRK